MELNSRNRQFAEEISESAVLFTDRELYLSGEYIWFSCFIKLNGNPQIHSPGKILYVELLDRNQRAVQKGKFLIKENTGSGSMQIPAEALSEIYFLRAYTQFMKNDGPEHFACVPLTVVNPEYSLPPAGKGPSEEIPDAEVSGELRIETNKSIFDSREKVEVKLHQDGKGLAKVCVSVVRHGTGQSAKDKPTRGIASSGEESRNLFWVPDIRGVSFSGFLREKSTGSPISGKEVYLSVMGESPILHITETHSNGSFIFSLDELLQTKEINMEFKNGTGSDIEILINNDFSIEPCTLPQKAFTVDSTLGNILTEMYINLQTGLAFNRSQVHYAAPVEKENMLFGKYDFSVRPDDYIDLESLEEVFYEIVGPVSIRKSGTGEKYFMVANYESGRMLDNDLLLLDNVPVFDVDELLKIPPTNIERIDVINRPYFLGSKMLENVILITTKTSDFGGFQFPAESIFLEFLLLSPETSFEPQIYQTPEQLTSTVPDFRTLLYWNPLIVLDGETPALELFTADNTGQYDIVVRGITDQGKVIWNKTPIWIR
ncbi:MAG: hypothetical protein ACLFPE_04045 [Bacteroidales bacterium]